MKRISIEFRANMIGRIFHILPGLYVYSDRNKSNIFPLDFAVEFAWIVWGVGVRVKQIKKEETK